MGISTALAPRYFSPDGLNTESFEPEATFMPKQARVAILMATLVIFAITMLALVRSKVEASGRAFRSAAIQYSNLKKIYTAPADLLRGAHAGQDKADSFSLPRVDPKKG